ncbi:acylneuraminate cytidylyltransferase family protein [Pelagibacteraceae bacterium]|nr:acylneuraminate cytidylyltransferase family protein [Pelagibacteraceae bacterium]
MSFLAFIPARSGSTAVKNKNLVKINNKELIYWTINAAKECKFIKKIIVSTDSKKIANIAIKYGAEVPFLRPKSIAKNNSKTIDSIIHFSQNYDYSKYKDIVLLQPTSPFRTKFTLNKSIQFYIKNKFNSLVSVSLSKKNKDLLFKIKRNKIYKSSFLSLNNKRRQDFDNYYYVNGAIYINNMIKLQEDKKFITKNSIPFLMDPIESIDIDDIYDLELSKIIGNKILK